jgi:hypothetical protein
MRPVSAAFLRAIRGSHRAATEAYVVAPGQSGVSPTGTQLAIISGDVQIDSGASILASLDLTVDGTELFPDASSDLLTPYGNEIFVRRGIAFGGGTFEWVSLGYFRINSADQEEAPNGPIQISAQDRMAGIVEGRLVSPIQYAATDTYGDIVTGLVTEIYPAATIEWDDDTDTDAVGRSLIAEEDRYAFLNDLVTSLGKIWYWDYRGVLVIKDVPDETSAVWDVNAGSDGVLVSLSRSLSRDGVYNGVVAYGEALDTETPARAVAVDNNPDSPTYWDGSFGKVPRYYSSPFITTDAQALSAATSILKQNLGLPYSVDFNVIPNPALEAWDPVTVSYDYKVETHVIDTMTIPLTNDQPMKATTRVQTVVMIGEE